MIIKYAHCDIKYTKRNKTSEDCKRKKPKYEVKCDCCGKIFIETQIVFEKRMSLINLEYCGKCSRPKMSSLAALKGVYNEDGSLKPNAGRFSKQRVDDMSEDEYKIFCEQRKRASSIFHNRLKNDPELFTIHYDKVFKNSKIGYISKAQRDIHSILEPFGFELEKTVEGFRADIVNIEKKIVFEYYGDLWHANPRIYKPDDYINVINMTAKEKWDKDRKRNFALRNLGYIVVVIWENKKKNERKELLKRLGNYIDENFENVDIYRYEESKNKQMYNSELDKNKLVLREDVQSYIDSGWVLGFKRRNKE